jgi:hypothetical protein
MSNLNGTETHANLKAAFAGESQANRRYLWMAKIADVETCTLASPRQRAKKASTKLQTGSRPWPRLRSPTPAVFSLFSMAHFKPRGNLK